MKQQVKINKVKGNPSNPRIIKNDKFLKLVKSIQEFPEMLKLRPIVVEEEDMLSKNIKAPTYDPKNEKPSIDNLFDTQKADELINKIKEAELSEEELMFLSHCALRHTVYNYSKIADYYAHSRKEVQELMEESALVVIDLDDAISNGFVKLTKNIQELYKEEYE